MTHKRIVVIGGGQVALRRVRSLLEAGAEPTDITVIAPQIAADVTSLGVHCNSRPYQVGDCIGALVVVIATNDPSLNEQVAREAQAAGALVNRCDRAEAGTLTVMAHRRTGPVTLAAATDGISAAAARQIVTDAMAQLDDDWPTLLAAAAEFRSLIQQRIADDAKRQAVLRQLTDEAAMSVLKQEGVPALQQHYKQLTDENHAQ